MLKKPSIMKIPTTTYPSSDGINACYSNFTVERNSTCCYSYSHYCSDYSCHIFNGNNCIDANLDAWEAGGIIVAGVAVGIWLT